jgi:exonuclease SbcC
MKINRLHLENIRSYDDQIIDFPEGTILVHGENGAGKSSLLMGLFGGLFLSNITTVGSNNFNLADLVRRGEDKGRVELVFETNGDTYTVEWEMPGADSGAASSATLTSEALAEPVSGITNVQQQVTNLLGMDEDDFSSSAYVKQGEIDRLIETNNRAAMIDSLLGLDQIEVYIERAKMARRGAGRVYDRNQDRRRAHEDNRDDYEYDEAGYTEAIGQCDARIDDRQSKIESFEEHINEQLSPLLNEVETAIEEYDRVSSKLADKRDQIEEAEEKQAEARREKQNSEDAIEEREAKIDDLREEISAINADVEYDLSTGEAASEALEAIQDDLLAAQEDKNSREKERDHAEERLAEAREEYEEATDALAEAREEAEALSERIEEAEATVSEHEDAFAEQVREHTETIDEYDLDTDLNPEANPDEAADTLATLAQVGIPDRRDALNDRVNDLTAEVATLETRADTLSAEIDELRDLEDAGECPKCGQDVEEAHVDEEIAKAEAKREDVQEEIEEKEKDRERLQRRSGQLSGLRNAINDTRSFREETLADARERVEELSEHHEDAQDDIENHEAEAEQLETRIETKHEAVEDAESAFAEANEHMEDVADTRSTLKRADRKYDAIEDHQHAIEQEQATIEHAEATVRNLDSQLDTLRDERDDLAERFGDLDDPDALAERKREIDEEIAEYEAKIDDAQSEIKKLQEERGRLRTKRSGLRDLHERIEECERKERWADSVREEIEDTLSIYKSVQSDLRETYLTYINEYTNDIFKDIYKNSSYQQVQVTETHDDTHDTYDYDIKLLREDGTTEDPANASGGERAVVNLALRAGIYRLIAQIRGGDQSTLPPFILDEPTTFLDEGHVGQLEEMLDTITDWDVPQVVVVSHDESLIHGADHECLVTKDSDGASSVEMRLAGERYEETPTEAADADAGEDKEGAV